MVLGAINTLNDAVVILLGLNRQFLPLLNERFVGDEGLVVENSLHLLRHAYCCPIVTRES